MDSEKERPAILLVEDDPSTRQVLAQMLEEKYRVLTAADGLHALQIACSTPDLCMVLTDLMMPVMDGFALIKAISEQLLTLPVVVMTAHDQRSDILEALRAGAYDFLTKPFEFDVVDAAVQRAINHRAYLQVLQDQRELRAALATAMRVAHEINNPLTVIKTTVEYHLANPALSPELRADLLSIIQAVDGLAAQINLLPKIRHVVLDERFGSPMLDLERAIEADGGQDHGL